MRLEPSCDALFPVHRTLGYVCCGILWRKVLAARGHGAVYPEPNGNDLREFLRELEEEKRVADEEVAERKRRIAARRDEKTRRERCRGL
jgi:hypothetical protein